MEYGLYRKLTKRQLEIADCVRKGFTDGEIANALDLSVFTVKSHLRKVYEKMEVSGRTELAGLPDWHVKAKKVNHNVAAYDLNQLIKKGWTIEIFAQEIINVFYKTIDNLADDNVSTLEEMVEIIKFNNETKKILIDSEGAVIGCWSLDPLFDEYFEKDKKGEFYVSEFTKDAVPIFVPGNTYNIHFGAICLVGGYRRLSIFKILLYSIVEYIERLAINDIFINEICTQAYSREGRALAKSLGLHYCAEHKDSHGQVYCGIANELLRRTFLNDFDILKSLYASS
jgi:DNA-binding CsgD family transcriptional regulator